METIISPLTDEEMKILALLYWRAKFYLDTGAYVLLLWTSQEEAERMEQVQLDLFKREYIEQVPLGIVALHVPTQIGTDLLNVNKAALLEGMELLEEIMHRNDDAMRSLSETPEEVSPPVQ